MKGERVSEEVWEIGLCLYSDNKFNLCCFFIFILKFRVISVSCSNGAGSSTRFRFRGLFGTSCCILLLFNEGMLAFNHGAMALF